MLTGLLALAALMQQMPQAPQSSLAPSPVSRIAFASGPELTMVAGDSVRLAARALDANGQPVPNASIRYFLTGGYFEGSVDTSGVVRSGATGSIVVGAVATVPGTKPYLERLRVRMVPGPAASISVTPSVSKLAVGQRVRLSATSWSAAKDERSDPIAWRSSASRVADVSRDGVLTALAPGRAVITASVENVRTEIPVEVIATQVASVAITPARIEAKEGDVLRLSAVARDANGREIPGSLRSGVSPQATDPSTPTARSSAMSPGTTW